MPTIDFDAYLAERKAAEGEQAEPTTFRFGGKDWKLPSELPASIVLDVIRYTKTAKSEDDMDIKTMDRIGSTLFGEDQWRALLVTPLADGFPIKPADVGRLVLVAIGATGATKGEARPNRKTRRAQKPST